MPPKVDALDDLDFLDELEGWSINEMARTIGRMIKGADNVAKCLANGAESMTELYSPETPAGPRDIQSIAMALQAVSNAIERYTGIYTWAQAQGKTGKEDKNALNALLPYLELEEMATLQRWLNRMEPVA